MTIFFTSDHHFSHEGLLLHGIRPAWRSTHEMDEDMVAQWNATVRQTDTVYHLGDFTLGSTRVGASFLDRLNFGHMYLVPGGHDKRWLKPYRQGRMSTVGFAILPPIMELKLLGRTIVLCHYPMLSWEKSHYGSLHLHGHTHGTIDRASLSHDVLIPPDGRNGKRLDVSVDCWRYCPVSLEEVIETLG